jgi:hypothetical protein
VLAGMKIPSGAATRRGSRATRLDGGHGWRQPAMGPGPQLQRPPVTRPARPAGAAAPSRRGPQSWRGTLHLGLPSRKRERRPVTGLAGAGHHALRSMLGPHGIRNRWSPAGTSGHGRWRKIAGHSTFTATTSDGEAAWGRVRAPPLAPELVVGVPLCGSLEGAFVLKCAEPADFLVEDRQREQDRGNTDGTTECARASSSRLSLYWKFRVPDSASLIRFFG